MPSQDDPIDAQDEPLDDIESPASGGAPTKDEKQMAMFCHIGGIIGGFIVPLIIWMIKKDESKFIDRHGKEALNFNITLLIAYMVIGTVTCGLGVIIILPVSIIFFVKAGLAANAGEDYQYPLNIRFIT